MDNYCLGVYFLNLSSLIIGVYKQESRIKRKASSFQFRNWGRLADKYPGAGNKMVVILIIALRVVKVKCFCGLSQGKGWRMI